MSATLQHLHASAPFTERGKPTVLTVDPRNEKLVYGNGNIIYMRNIRNPLICETYTLHAAAVTCARYSPSGFYIASGDAAGNVRIWATDNIDKTLKLELRPITGPVLDICWSPDNQRIVVVGDGKDKFAHVFIWDSGSQVGEISGHSKAVTTCSYRPIRPFRIATGSEDLQVNFFQGPPFKFMHSNSNHTRFVNCVRYSPNGAKFVSVASDGKGYFYDGSTGVKTGELGAEGAHGGSIYAVTWSPDSTKVATASADKTVKTWNADTGNLIATYTFGSTAIDFQQLGIAWTNDTIISLSFNGDIHYLDPTGANLQPTRSLEAHNKLINALAYDKATNTFFTGSYDGVIVAWEYGSGSKGRIRGKTHTNGVTGIAVTNGQVISCGVDDQVRFATLNNLSFREETVHVDATPADIAAAKDNSGLVAVVSTKYLALVKDGATITSVSIPFTGSALDFSYDGREIAVGGTDKKVHIFAVDGDSLTETAVIEGHRGSITTVRYSPDGQSLAVGDSNREVIVWDKTTRQVKVDGLVFHTSRVTSMAFSDDSRYLVSGALDTNVIVTDLVNTQSRIIIRNAHMQGVTGVAFVNENTVASAGNDCCLKTWTIKF